MAKTVKILILLLLIITPFLLFEMSAAQELPYTPLEPLPGVDQTGSAGSLASILSFAFRTAFTLGGLLAVITLIWGGIIYMFSEVVNKKQEAKERIRAALWGLFLLLASWLILRTINPDLLDFSFVISTEPGSAAAPMNTPYAWRQFSNEGEYVEAAKQVYCVGVWAREVIPDFLISEERVAAVTSPEGCLDRRVLVFKTAFSGGSANEAFENMDAVAEEQKKFIQYCEQDGWYNLREWKAVIRPASFIGSAEPNTNVMICINERATVIRNFLQEAINDFIADLTDSES